MSTRAEPGFYVVQDPMPRGSLERLLMPDATAPVLEKFRSLNPHLSQWAKPGQMAVMSASPERLCTVQEAMLMEAAAKVDAALTPLSDDDARFLVRNRDFIEPFLQDGSGALGTASLMVGKHLDDLGNTLRSLEQLYQRSFDQTGTLRGNAFFAERQQLMRQLDASLGPLVRKGVGLPDHPSLRHALGLSSRSLLHHWSKAGRAGAIPGYSTYLEGTARAARYIKYGGYVGIALDAGYSGSRIYTACTVGRSEECRRVQLTEAGRFGGGLVGGALGGYVGTLAVAPICAAIGVGTFGVGGMMCGLVVVGTAGTIAGGAGNSIGETAGELVYEGVR